MSEKVFLPDDVAQIDTNSSWLGVSQIILMENAGRGVADEIFARYPPKNFSRVTIVCGTGNNGGDGFVTARHLASMGYKTTVILLGDEKKIRSESAKANWNIIKNMFLSIRRMIIKDSSELSKLEQILDESNIVVDAILGVGSRGAPRGLYGEAIKLINKKKREKKFHLISIDVPSGLDTFEGKFYEPFIDADLIITFVANKKGLDAIDRDKVIIKHIGEPPESYLLAGPGDVLKILKDRPAWSHKGDFGKIMVIGGSKEFYGAPALTALAILKTGSDLAIVYAPKPAANAIKCFSPNLIVRTLDGDFLGLKHIDQLVEEAEKFDVIVIGPGLSLYEETLKAAHELIEKISRKNKKLVIDADGLKALAKYGLVSGKIIITPHEGEFSLLFGEKPSRDLNQRGNIVKKKAFENKITILLKGHIDVISNGKEVKYNKTGNPGMTVGGTGDVLTGVVASLYSIYDDELTVASAAAFLTGYAGDLAYNNKGYSITATDVLEYIPTAIINIRNLS